MQHLTASDLDSYSSALFGTHQILLTPYTTTILHCIHTWL